MLKRKMMIMIIDYCYILLLYDVDSCIASLDFYQELWVAKSQHGALRLSFGRCSASKRINFGS